MRRLAVVLAGVGLLLSTARAQTSPEAPDPTAPTAAPEVQQPELGPALPPAEPDASQPALPEPSAQAPAPPAATAQDPEFERLFGEAGEGGAMAGPPPLEAPELPLWTWGLLIIAVVALVVTQSKRFGRPPQDASVKVVSRATLGRDGNLAVVEVGDGAGGTRRLLVGFGTGAPRLVADLTPMPDFTEPFAPSAAASRAAESRAAELQARAVPIAPTSPPRPADPTSRRWEDALRDAEAPDEGADEAIEQEGTTLGGGLARIRRPRNLQSRDDLIAEVLAERGRPGGGGQGDLQSDLQDDPFGADEAGEGGSRPRGTYTHRGTQ